MAQPPRTLASPSSCLLRGAQGRVESGPPGGRGDAVGVAWRWPLPRCSSQVGAPAARLSTVTELCHRQRPASSPASGQSPAQPLEGSILRAQRLRACPREVTLPLLHHGGQKPSAGRSPSCCCCRRSHPALPGTQSTTPAAAAPAPAAAPHCGQEGPGVRSPVAAAPL